MFAFLRKHEGNVGGWSKSPTSAKLFLAVALLLAPSLVAAKPKSTLVLVGGAMHDPALYQEVLRLAGGGQKARVGILTTGSRPESEDPAAGTDQADNARIKGDHYIARFHHEGAATVEWIPIDLDHLDKASSPEVVAQIARMNVLFFGGGDQERIRAALVTKDGRDTPALAAIRRAHRAGTEIVGTSAGSVALVRGPMITGGEGASDVTHDARGGLGLFRLGIVDTHFSQRARGPRLMELTRKTRARTAFGIDENTALIVQRTSKGPRVRALGQGNVTVYRREGGKIFESRLSAGDRFVPGSGKIKFGRK